MARHIEEVPSPPPPGAPGRLGDKIEATIERVIAWAINTAGDAISSILRRGLELLLEALAEILAPFAQSMHDEIVDNPYVPDYVKNSLRRPSPNTDAGDALFSVVYIITAVVGGWRGLIAPSSRLSEQYVDKALFSARPDPTAAVPMMWRMGLPDFFRAGMQELGWHPSYIDAWVETIRPRMAAVDLFRSAHRGEITFQQARDELQHQGWTTSDISKVEALTFQLPGAGDLIAMSVRGAFNPDEIAEFQLGAEFPPEFADWMTKQGFASDWSLRYWYSHWVLPPLTAGYEMLHRGIIDSDQLDLLLKTQDISPFWRDKLRELSYNPLTRVDVRRMYGMGVLTRDEVYQSYLDIGYSPENAERMTEFTIRYETDADRDATKSDILAGLREGMLTEVEATSWLVAIGYGADIAAFLVAKEVAKLARSLLDQEIDIVKDLYIHREITEAEARTQLAALGLSSNEIDIKITDWSITRRAQLRRPTQDQASRFLRYDIITVAQFRSMLSDLGYQTQYIDWYLDNVLMQKADDQAKQEQDALAEQEAITLRTLKNEYQIDKAEVAVRIAEIQAAITDIQIAIEARTRRYQEDRQQAKGLLTETQIREGAAGDIAALEEQINAQREAIAFLRAQIDARETTIAEFRVQVATQHTEIEPEVEEVQATISGYQAELQDLTTQIEQLQTQQAEARQAIVGMTADIDTLQADVSGVQAGILDYQAQIDSAQTQVAEAREIMASAPADVEQLRLDIVALETIIGDRQVDIDAAQTQIAEHNLTIAEIKEALPAQVELAATDEEAEAIEMQAAQRVLEIQTDIRELQVEIEQHQDTIANTQSAIAANQERIRQMGVTGEITVAEQTVIIASLRTRIEQLQDTIAEGRQAISETQEQIRLAQEAVASDIAGQELSIATLDAEIETLQDQQAVLREQIANSQRQITDLEQPLTRTTTAIEQSQLVIERAQDDIADANATIAALTSQISARREEMRQTLDLIGRVRTLEQIETAYRDEITQLESQLSALKIALLEAREEKAQLHLTYREQLL